MTKNEIHKTFDPNGISLHDSCFGLPYNYEQSEVILFPVPWDVTVSYGHGTSNGPSSIKSASHQVDLEDPSVKNAWKMGLSMMSESRAIKKKNDYFRTKANRYISALSKGREHLLEKTRHQINHATREMVSFVYSETRLLINDNKLVGLIGGDHSTPLGYIKALAEKHKKFGILQVDAHCDLRKTYENFDHSHASIMYNILDSIPQVTRLVQVGVRDYCKEELDYINKAGSRVTTFFDRDLKHKRYQGVSWADQVKTIIKTLPKEVYISFDIDGLDPKLCPNTGTPVPGGFDMEQVLYLFEQLVQSKRQIIGFDLVEVSPGENEWDANVAARILYRLSNLMGKSNSRI